MKIQFTGQTKALTSAATVEVYVHFGLTPDAIASSLCRSLTIACSP